MKISLNWLSEYIDVAPIKADPKGVLSKLTMRGLAVESIHDLSKGFEKVVIALVEKRDKHPNAERLSVCQVNTGKEKLQIVCGAANVRAGAKIALSMVGAVLPNGMKIEKSKIRDVESFGMICSESELGLADESEGIIILPDNAPVGEPLAPFLGRDDVVFELDLTPNRGDGLSHIGIARELASILGQRVKLPQTAATEAGGDVASKIKVTLQSESCLQYHGRYIEGVKIGESPDWLKKRLTAVGLRPINNVVDVTNFVLMEFGQPLHAFDCKNVKGGHIIVRPARAGEKMPLLDDTTVALDPTDLVIADEERAVALAGVMGGGNSEVSDSTTNILLEGAQFAPSSVRRTARRHQKHTDSSHRFERGVDAKAVRAAMDRAAALMVQVAGGKLFKGAVSRYSKEGERLALGEPRAIKLSVDEVNRFLGMTLSEKDIQDSLLRTGFSVDKSGAQLVARVPSYRPDVEIVEDVYEEVLRIWGYEKLGTRVPRLEFIPEPANAVDVRTRQLEKLKLTMAEQGFSEAVNFAFTARASNDRWGGPQAGRAVGLANPLNEDLTTLKTSLVGGLLDNLLTSVRHQQRDVRLFEVRPVFVKEDASETGVREEWFVTALITGRAYIDALPARDRSVELYDAKGALETAVEAVGARGLRYQAFEGGEADPRLHPAQCARVALGRGPCGIIGRLHPRLETELKLRQPLYLFEVSLDRMLEVAKTDRKFLPLARFPKVERDLSLLVPAGLSAEKVLSSVQKSGKPLLESVAVVDLYQGDKIPAGTRSVSISFILADPGRTLEDPEVEAATQKILSGLDRDLGVKLRLQ
jgi:phenylalanyl-tRNA synthetase beta chain